MIALEVQFSVAEINGHYVVKMVRPGRMEVDSEVPEDVEGEVWLETTHVCMNQFEVRRLMRHWLRDMNTSRESILQEIQEQASKEKPRR